MFSVIIPNYNQEKYIRESIQSVLDQTHRDFEIIVIDDGSTDQSIRVIDEFQGKVKYVWQENKGLAGARNTGIKAAQGDFIAFLDADDIWLPTYLETMHELINTHPEGSIYYCCAQCINIDGGQLPQLVGISKKTITSKQEMYQTLLRANFLIPSTITARREILFEAGLFDQNLRYCEDIDLWLRIAPDHLFVGTNSCQVLYRIHNASLSTNPQKTQQTKLQVIEKHFGTDDENWESWSLDKRRAIGGAYRFQTLNSVQQANNWMAAGESLRKALSADPTLAKDVDLFYELALGNHPKGFRDQAKSETVVQNAKLTNELLERVFTQNQTSDTVRSIMNVTYSTANYAIGLAIYNAGDVKTSRRFFWLALQYSPGLGLSSPLLSYLLKTMMGDRLLEKLRKIKGTQNKSK